MTQRFRWRLSCALSLVAIITGARVSVSLGQGIAEAAPGTKAVERPTDDARRAAVVAALNAPTDVDFVDAPLKDVVDFLATVHRLRIAMDTRALEANGIARETPITLTAKRVSLRSALNLVLLNLELTWIVRQGGIWITTADDSAKYLETVVLNVSDLVLPGSEQFADRKADLLSAIQDHVGGATPGWSDDGGAGELSISEDGVLVASSVWPVLRDVEELVEVIRNEARRTANANKSEGKPAVVFASSQGAFASLHDKLRAATSVDFVDAPLVDVCRFLEDRHGLPIFLHRRALEESGVGADSPITIRIENAPVREVLHEVLAPLNLKFAVRDDVVLVSTEDQLTRRMRWGVYSVADFAPSQDIDDVSESLAHLADLIQRHTGKPSPGWVEYGGAGQLSTIRFAKSLVLSTTDDVHDEVGRLLSEYRVRRPASPTALSPPMREQRSYRLLKLEDGRPPFEAKAMLELIRETLPKEAWKSEPRQMGDLYIIEQTPLGHRKVLRKMQQLTIPLVPAVGGISGGGGGGGFF